MKREMWITAGHVQRFSIVTDVNKACEETLKSEFPDRESAEKYMEENRATLRLRAWHGVFPYSRRAITPAEVEEAVRWQEIQAEYKPADFLAGYSFKE